MPSAPSAEDRRNNERNASNGSNTMEVNSNESVTITSPTTSGGGGTTTINGEQMKLNFFNSLKQRGFDTICLLNGNDADIFDFIQV